MMDSSLNLNRKKLSFWIGASIFISIYLGALSFFFLVSIKGFYDIGKAIFIICLIFCFILPLLTAGLVLLKFQIKKRLLNKYESLPLAEIGFARINSSAGSDWRYSKDVFVGIRNGFSVKCFIQGTLIPKLSINIVIDMDCRFFVENYSIIENLLALNIKVRKYSLVKEIPLSKGKEITGLQLGEILDRFTSEVFAAGINPGSRFANEQCRELFHSKIFLNFSKSNY